MLPSSSTQYSPAQIDALRQMGRDKGLPDDVIESKLAQAGVLGGGGPGLGNQFMQGLGKIARVGVQAAGGLAGIPFGMAGAAYQGVTGKEPPAMLQPQGVAAADQMGLPRGESPAERTLMAGAEGAVQGAVFPGSMAVNAGLGGAGMAASQGAAESGAGPLGQMAAQAAVSLGVPIVGQIAAAATRSAIMGSASRQQAARQSAGGTRTP